MPGKWQCAGSGHGDRRLVATTFLREPVGLYGANIGGAMKLFLTGILAATMFSGSRADAQSPKVDELISKATAYAHLFVERFSNVVAEERYERESPRQDENGSSSRTSSWSRPRATNSGKLSETSPK